MSENVGSHVCHLLVLPATGTAIYWQISQRWHSNFNSDHPVVFEVNQYIQLINSTHLSFITARDMKCNTMEGKHLFQNKKNYKCFNYLPSLYFCVRYPDDYL